MKIVASFVAVTALLVLIVAGAHGEGIGPCLTAAGQDYRACKAGCRESFQLAKDLCTNRDHNCVEDCRATRATCRQPIVDTLNAGLAVCQSDLDGAVAICRQLYADGTPERDTCIDNAQVIAFQCRDGKREQARPGLKQCRRDFKACVNTNCPPLSTPDPSGVRACKSDARDLFDICKADCLEAKQLAKDTCLDRDHGCVENCRAARDSCRVQPLADLASDIAACNATRDTAIGNCPPPGDPGRDACIDAAQVVAFQCRDAARERQAPDLAACRAGFQACAQACPPPPAP